MKQQENNFFLQIVITFLYHLKKISSVKNTCDIMTYPSPLVIHRDFLLTLSQIIKWLMDVPSLRKVC